MRLYERLTDRLSHAVEDRPRPGLTRWALAIIVMSLATLARMALHPMLESSGFAIYFAAVVVVGWVSGLVPCLVAELMSFVLTATLFPEPPDPAKPPAANLAGLGAFFFVGIAAAILGDATRGAQRRARAQAEEAIRQREQLRTTLACIGEAVIVTDSAARVTMLNSIAEQLTGWSSEQAVGRPLADVFQLTDELSGEPVRDFLAGATLVGPAASRRLLLLANRDGEQRPITLTAAPIQEARGKSQGMVLIFRDETGQRQTEQALKLADRRKDEFLAVLAHELRNPLAPIGNAIEVLRLSNDPEMREQARAMMQRQFQNLVRLVDDLLDVSRIARGKISLRPELVSICDIFHRAVETARPVLDSQEHTLTVDCPEPSPTVWADPVRLSQVVTNLLTNAAKYTNPGGHVNLSCRVEGKRVAIGVRDSGIGIPAEALPRVFDLFMQIDHKHSRPSTGLGIGLTLVKSLVQLHGGEVHASSEGPGQGSEFTVSLPLAESAAPVDPPRAGSISGALLHSGP